MDYQALYRKYRPRIFDEIVGQDHVTTTLAREIADGKVAHAYLFAGPRGTGKTTSARILAKALNCQNRKPSGEPCDACTSCDAITQGASFDVTELDAASHNSVDDIRDIKVSVTTVASVGGAKRVFILDEAHMLSKAAGNALLKTLEEPPDHVHFVLATTEPYKLLDTIRSRSQRFDFHPVSVETLVEHLTKIAELEGYEAGRDGLVAVARHAKGSVRDALSLLEQVAALGAGTVDISGVNRALGLADRDVYLSLAGAIADHDPRTALQLVAGLASDGVDLRRFVSESIAFFRGVFLAHYAPDLGEVADELEETLADWRDVAATLPPAQVIRAIDLLSDGLLRLREGREERLMTELTLLKLTRPEVAADLASVGARIDTIEQRVSAIARQAKSNRSTPAAEDGPDTDASPSGVTGVTADSSTPPSEATPDTTSEPDTTTGPDTVTEETGQPAPDEPNLEIAPEPDSGLVAVPEPGHVTVEDIDQVWPALVATVREHLGSRRQALFREAKPERVDGATVILEVPAHLTFHLAQLEEDPEIAEVVAERASELLRSEVSVRFERAGAPVLELPVESAAAVDKDDLVEADDAAVDPVALVEDILDGEVVDET